MFIHNHKIADYASDPDPDPEVEQNLETIEKHGTPGKHTASSLISKEELKILTRGKNKKELVELLTAFVKGIVHTS